MWQAAFEAARELSGEELFLPVQSLDIEKGKSSRIFDQSKLRAPSIIRRMEGGKKGAKAALKGLKNKGFLESLEKRKLHASTKGNLVKHVFDDVAREMSLQDPMFDKNRPEGVEAIMTRLQREAAASEG